MLGWLLLTVIDDFVLPMREMFAFCVLDCLSVQTLVKMIDYCDIYSRCNSESVFSLFRVPSSKSSFDVSGKSLGNNKGLILADYKHANETHILVIKAVNLS